MFQEIFSWQASKLSHTSTVLYIIKKSMLQRNFSDFLCKQHVENWFSLLTSILAEIYIIITCIDNFYLDKNIPLFLITISGFCRFNDEKCYFTLIEKNSFSFLCPFFSYIFLQENSMTNILKKNNRDIYEINFRPMKRRIF